MCRVENDAPDPSNTANFLEDDGQANGYDDGYAVTGSTSLNSAQNYLTDVGAYMSSLSPYGTFDQGGNVWEWTDELVFGESRLRGGAWNVDSDNLGASDVVSNDLTFEGFIGIRVASVPEPAIITLCIAVLMLLNGTRPFGSKVKQPQRLPP